MSTQTFDGIEQRSEAWYALRRGIVTASTVGRLITARTLSAIDYACPACGAPTGCNCVSKAAKTAGAPIKTLHPERAAVAREVNASVLAVAEDDDSQALTWQLFAERITETTEDTFVSSDMMRGVFCEPIARDAYSEHYGAATEVAFMRRDEDDWRLGFSPDGLVGDDGLIEIKAPRAKTHIRTILTGEVPAQYVAQCQAGLLVSGRQWLDFVSFSGGLPLFVKRVYPDPQWFEVITEAATRFERVAAEMAERYRVAVAGMPTTERVDYDLEVVV